MVHRRQNRLQYWQPMGLTHTLVSGRGMAKEFARLGAYPWSRVDVEGFPVPIYVCFGKTQEDRVVVTGLMLSPGVNSEISARLLREIPLGHILVIPKVGLVAGYVRSAEPYQPPRAKPGPKGWPRSHFERVAESYRSALVESPRTPIRVLMSQFGGPSEATVHRWLQRCKDMGLDLKPVMKSTAPTKARRRTKR
jgi:hypothetical protein